MNHIKKFSKINEEVRDFSESNKESFKMYKKSLKDLVDYIKDNDIEKDAEKFLEKNIDKRCSPLFSMGSDNINKLVKQLKNLKK
jgi:hypothetical protein